MYDRAPAGQETEGCLCGCDSVGVMGASWPEGWLGGPGYARVALVPLVSCGTNFWWVLLVL